MHVRLTPPPLATPALHEGPGPTSRRRLLQLAAGGVGLGWLGAPQASNPPAALVQGDQLTPAFWAQTFERPEGGTLNMASLRGKPLVLNFWATWCPPCVKEMPELDRFQRAQRAKGWQVVGLAIDGPTPVREFLKKVRVGFALGLVGMDGSDLAQALGNTSGGLPFTVLIDPKGQIAWRKLGALKGADLQPWVAKLTP
ncbi:MAG: hypothetical protein RI907_2409 [Pseudomonadota bacterium]|jgi:thiol-disulfide isomerase/thioredoxin